MKLKAALAILVLFTVVFAGCDNGSSGGDDVSSFVLKSSAFTNNQRLADKYCYSGVGLNTSLPFTWEGAPDDTKSFTLIIHDPNGGNWVHWAVFNIPANCASIPEGASLTIQMPAGCVELNNEFGTPGYGGPMPPPGSGTHNYKATLYAMNVDSISGLSGFKNYQQITELLAGKFIKKALLTGTYSR